MTVKQLVNSFQSTHIDNHEENGFNFKVNGRYRTREEAQCNDSEVANFFVSTWSDGSARVEIFTK